MNPEERKLIADLFDRLRAVEAEYREPEADAFIRGQVARQPHAPYAMAQTLIVQTQALEAAQARITELENDLERSSHGAPTPAPWGSRAGGAMEAPGGFGAKMGGLFGRKDDRHGHDRSGFGAAQQQSARGGGFLSGALQTAAGVAGGALLFSGISSLFGGDEAKAAASEASEPAQVDANAGAAETGQDGEGGWFSGLTGGGADESGGGDDWN